MYLIVLCQKVTNNTQTLLN